MRKTLRLAVPSMALLLSGCFGGVGLCEKRTDYKAIKATPPIRVPAELDPLPDVSQLEIPPSSTPPDVDQSCLEKPPRYFEEEGTAG